MLSRRVDAPLRPPGQPVCALILTVKLKDADNASAPELSFQRKAVEDFHSCLGEVPQPQPQPTDLSVSSTQPTPTVSMSDPLPRANLLAQLTATGLTSRKHSIVISDDDQDKDTDDSSIQCRSFYPITF